jgi:hypothetical protein
VRRLHLGTQTCPRRGRRSVPRVQEIHRMLGTLAPIRKLPQEILGSILRDACESPVVVDPDPGNQTVTVLRTVCKRWDTTIINNPEIWNRISFHGVSYTYEPNTARDVVYLMDSFFQDVLQYSGAMPLAISLWLKGKHMRHSGPRYELEVPIPPDLWSPVLERLSPHVDRIRELTVITPLTTLLYNGLAPLRGRFLNLQVLSLQLVRVFRRSSGDVSKVFDCDIFAHAPKLHTVYLSEHLLAHKLILPWNQITTVLLRGHSDLCMTNQTLQRLFWSLQRFPQLNTGVFDVSEVVPLPEREIRLSPLSSLYLLCRHSTELTNIFDYTQLPRLETLSIQFLESWDRGIGEWGFGEDGHDEPYPTKPTFPTQNFVDLSSRSGFSLTTLKLSNVTIPPDTVVILLPLLDRLHTLCIRNVNSFSGLLISSMQAGALPQLKNLFFSTCERVFPCTGFTNMVKSRCYLNVERSGGEETATLERLIKVKIVLLKLEDEQSFSVDQLKEFESIQSKAGPVEIDIWTGKGRLLRSSSSAVGESLAMARCSLASSTTDEVKRPYDLNDEESDL